MTEAEFPIPVFMTGNNRDWTKTDGTAVVQENGQILITLHDQTSADMLVDMDREKILLQLAFDYRQSDYMINKINEQHRGTRTRN